MTNRPRLVQWLALPALLLTTSACVLGLGAAAGAAGAIAYTQRGAEANVDAPVSEVVAATEAVFAEQGITIVNRSTAEDGTQVELRAERGDTDIAVEIEDTGATTQVEVYSVENVVAFDPEDARDLLRRILDRL